MVSSANSDPVVHPATEAPAVPAPVRMAELLRGFELSQALYVVAKLDIASALTAGPRSVEELAVATGCHADSLRRLVRALTGVGVFTQRDGDVVALTSLGATLAAGTPGSVRDLALMRMEIAYAPFTELVHTVRTGVPAATRYYGKPFFDWIAEDEQRVAVFTAAMASFGDMARGGTLSGYRPPPGRTIADIGGADGTQLAALLDTDPSRRGIVFDLPHVVPAARALLAQRGLDQRAEAVGGDFFVQAPAADVYLMSMILHDWDDAAATRILRVIKTAATPGARLLVVETIIPSGDEPHPSKILDLTMLGLLTGRERTRAEYEALLAAGGFIVDRIVPTPNSSSFSIIEATLG